MATRSFGPAHTDYNYIIIIINIIIIIIFIIIFIYFHNKCPPGATILQDRPRRRRALQSRSYRL